GGLHARAAGGVCAQDGQGGGRPDARRRRPPRPRHAGADLRRALARAAGRDVLARAADRRAARSVLHAGDLRRMRRNQPRRLSNFAAGAIALIVTVVAVYFGFTKAIPFQHHFTISATFPTANNLRKNSPV